MILCLIFPHVKGKIKLYLTSLTEQDKREYIVAYFKNCIMKPCPQKDKKNKQLKDLLWEFKFELPLKKSMYFTSLTGKKKKKGA